MDLRLMTGLLKLALCVRVFFVFYHLPTYSPQLLFVRCDMVNYRYRLFESAPQRRFADSMVEAFLCPPTD